MAETIVTRGGQITLTKDIRQKLHIQEGDRLVLHILGNSLSVSKQNIKAFEKGGFLSTSFPKVLKDMRSFSYSKRLKRLGVL